MRSLLFARLAPLLILKIVPAESWVEANAARVAEEEVQALSMRTANAVVLETQGTPAEKGGVGDEEEDEEDEEEAYSRLELATVVDLVSERAFGSVFEYDQVRKVASEVLGRLPPSLALPLIRAKLRDFSVATHGGGGSDADGGGGGGNGDASRDEDGRLPPVLAAKSAVYAVCHAVVCHAPSLEPPTVRWLVAELLTPLLLSTDPSGEVYKLQHGCIDALSFMVQVPYLLLQRRHFQAADGDGGGGGEGGGGGGIVGGGGLSRSGGPLIVEIESTDSNGPTELGPSRGEPGETDTVVGARNERRRRGKVVVTGALTPHDDGTADADAGDTDGGVDQKAGGWGLSDVMWVVACMVAHGAVPHDLAAALSKRVSQASEEMDSTASNPPQQQLQQQLEWSTEDLLAGRGQGRTLRLCAINALIAAAQRVPVELLPEMLSDLGPLLLVTAAPAKPKATETKEGGVPGKESAPHELNLRAAALQALFVAIFRSEALLANELSGGDGGFGSGPRLLNFVTDVFGVALAALRDVAAAVRLNGLKVIMALTTKVPDIFNRLPDAEGGLLQLQTCLSSMANVETDQQIRSLSSQLRSVVFEG